LVSGGFTSGGFTSRGAITGGALSRGFTSGDFTGGTAVGRSGFDWTGVRGLGRSIGFVGAAIGFDGATSRGLGSTRGAAAGGALWRTAGGVAFGDIRGASTLVGAGFMPRVGGAASTVAVLQETSTKASPSRRAIERLVLSVEAGLIETSFRAGTSEASVEEPYFGTSRAVGRNAASRGGFHPAIGDRCTFPQMDGPCSRPRRCASEPALEGLFGGSWGISDDSPPQPLVSVAPAAMLLA
jgi:hypothetical protein